MCPVIPTAQACLRTEQAKTKAAQPHHQAWFAVECYLSNPNSTAYFTRPAVFLTSSFKVRFNL